MSTLVGGFICGFVGFTLGFFITILFLSLCHISKESDKNMENIKIWEKIGKLLKGLRK